jgi:hypothetical protein
MKLFDKFLCNYATTNIDHLYKKHHGKTCYILGGGPSIKYFNLMDFDDEVIIATNSIVFHKQFKKLKTLKYVSIIEPWYFQYSFIQPNFYREISPITDSYRKIIKKTKHIEYFVNLSNFGRLNYQNVNYVYRNIPKFIKNECKLSKIDIFEGSITSAISLAYYMGFSKIYLVGFDAFTIKPAMNGSFYERGKDKGENMSNNHMQDFFKLFNNKIEIYTVLKSNKEYSPVLKTITYKELTGNNPVYKEIDDILDSKIIHLFETCYPKYYQSLAKYNK